MINFYYTELVNNKIVVAKKQGFVSERNTVKGERETIAVPSVN